MFLEEYLEPLNFCAENFNKLLDANNPASQKIVEKGLLLYRQGFVSQVKIDNNSIIGVVQDVTPVKVTLDLTFIQFSSCTCMSNGFCRHQLALFFYLLGQTGKVSTWLTDWRQPIPKKGALKNLPLRKASDLLPKSDAKEPNYTEWITTFNEDFDAIIGKNSDKAYTIAEMYTVYIRKLKNYAPFQNEWKLLYLLIGKVYTFKKLLQLSNTLQHSTDTINRYYRHVYHDLLNGVVECINKLANFTMPFAFDAFLQRLKDECEDILTINTSITFESIHIYRVLWTNIFTKKQWQQEELARLTGKETAFFTEKVACIHLQILLRKDKQALETIRILQIDIIPYMIYWIDYFNSRKAWNRLEPYIQAYTQPLKGYFSIINDDFDYCHEFSMIAIKSIMPFCEAKNRSDLLEKTYIQTLPFSFEHYERFLYEKEYLDKWIDLLTYMGIDIDMLHHSQIKMLQQYDQSLLLSLYHRSIQEHIHSKTREHYRIAVRQLKKLRTIYKKLKRQQEFDRFFTITLERTKRLRAFHEECRKGKLIHAEK
ncbi:SWIM zinc finger family protein [Niallia sp. 01092]|uniref:SWIM zinc finger family protein n=1 Tax=unclassified Niallia TaxID=2837522 RepID=UPI003FCEF0E0